MANCVEGNPEEYVDDLIHLETQETDRGIDLTAGKIYGLELVGALDFGGSEFSAADLIEISPELVDEDDDYGWWRLEGGTYVIRFNESVDPGDKVGLITPLPRLLATGATHPSLAVDSSDDGPLEVTVQVPVQGVRIKENARVSRLTVLS